MARLPPRQAATLVLRDVLGFATDEVASMLNTSQTAIKGTLQRARAALEHHRGGADRPRPGPAQERDLARRFAEAFTAADVDSVIAPTTHGYPCLRHRTSTTESTRSHPSSEPHSTTAANAECT